MSRSDSFMMVCLCMCVCLLCAVWDKAEALLSKLHIACSRRPLAYADLIMDAALLLWATSQPLFSSITSHNLSVCKPLLTHPLGTKVRPREAFCCRGNMSECVHACVSPNSVPAVLGTAVNHLPGSSAASGGSRPSRGGVAPLCTPTRSQG